jgi:hypothetical protein
MSDEQLRDPAAEAAAVDAGAVEAGAVDAGAVDSPPATDAPAAEPVTAEPVTAEALTPAAPAVQVDGPAAPVKVSRRPAVIAGLRRLLMFTLTVALFIGGIALGATMFQQTRPAAPGTDGSITVAGTPPTITQEFIAALAANDADAMRSSLGAQPNKDLTDEFTRFTIKRVTSVETLGTSVDGTRAATEILLRTEKDDGLPFEVNLVILVDGSTIEGFR